MASYPSENNGEKGISLQLLGNFDVPFGNKESSSFLYD